MLPRSCQRTPAFGPGQRAVLPKKTIYVNLDICQIWHIFVVYEAKWISRLFGYMVRWKHHLFRLELALRQAYYCVGFNRVNCCLCRIRGQCLPLGGDATSFVYMMQTQPGELYIEQIRMQLWFWKFLRKRPSKRPSKWLTIVSNGFESMMITK